MKDQSPKELGLVLILASDADVRRWVLNERVIKQETCGDSSRERQPSFTGLVLKAVLVFMFFFLFILFYWL